MTMSLVQRRVVILTLVLFILATAISNTHPVLAGKKVKSLAADQLEISAGSSVEATVTINKAAPSKGGVVYLSSDDDSVAKVPESVMVRPGETSALFVIDTNHSLSSSSIVISASYGKKTKKLTVTVKGVSPPAIRLTSLNLTPASVPGGTSAQGTISTNTPAPSGGVSVALSNGNPSAASIPDSVFIPGGSSQASFPIATSPVTTGTTASLSAIYAGVRKTALLNISADFATVSSLSVNPTSVIGGSSSLATVTLNIPAGFAGAVVSLSSNSPAAAAPGSVTVPAGATSASFTVTTSAVSASTPVTIAASYGNVTRTAQLTISAATAMLSSLALNPSTVIGGSVCQGTVNLSAPAGAGGVSVSISTGSSLVSAQNSVFVAAGSASASFTVTTSVVSVSTIASVTASYGGINRTATLTLQPGIVTPALSNLAVNPTTVTGGSTIQGMVSLTAVAPSGGALVALSSNNPAATPPVSVILPAGSASAAFPIATTQVPGTTSVSITASYLGVTKTASLTIDPTPAALSSVSLNPTSVVGGSSSQGTVVLNTAAPSGGAVVSLSSNNSAATVSSNVTVAAGATSAIFTVNTTSVSSSSSITISATYSSVTRSATLTVDPVAAALSSVELNPATVVGGNSSQGTVRLSTPAPAGSAISLSSNNSAATLPSTVAIAAGATSATFTINTTSVTTTRLITISGVYLGVTRTATLTVDPVPAAITSVTLNPTIVVGGNFSQGTVRLSTAAPAGGALVSLSSNNSAATVPANVTVGAGGTTATFIVNTTSVTSSRSVTISAIYTGVTRTATLTVDPVPATLSSLSLNPATVVGGSASQGTVTLSAAAPGGGALVSLSSNNSAATVPTSVTVAAGSTSATFSVNTTSVSSSRSVTITGLYSGGTRTASLTINPVAAALSTVALNPTSVVGGIGSQGTVSLTVGAPSGGAVVSISSNNSAATVPASVIVAAGATTATFAVNTTSVTSSRSATISAVYDGVTRTSALTVNPVSAALSTIAVNPATVYGGGATQGTVTLVSGAPAGGVVVSISSNNSAATVPANVTIPTGALSATFTVNATTVTSSRSVTISAVYGGVTRTALLTVNPPTAVLSSVTLNPTSVIGGNSSQGTVTLGAAAPTGGALVSLSSNNSAATVPTTVTVAAGSTSRAFTVSTTSVSTTRSVTISAVYSGVTRTASLYVDPVAPALTSLVLSPGSVVGGSPSQGTATLTAAAPPGGSVVSLSSTNPAVCAVAASVVVSGGSTAVTFPVTTSVVFSTSSVTISGSSGGGISGSSLTVQPLAADTTPPVISAVSSSGVISSGATISWTTNEASNTQVEYGTSAAYGSLTTLNPSIVTLHSVVLVGLTANTTYNYRVRSGDVAGNLAMSVNFSFTTAGGATGCPGFIIEGFAKTAVGGCGGTVYTVTNRNDSGPGSLRDFLNRPGPRIIRFGVSGTIDLLSDLNVTQPFLTVDGSTAPNGGICLRGGGLGIEAYQVIVRYIRIRPGANVLNPGSSSAIGVSALASNIVIDHCSLSWATDENLSIYGHNVTVQWSIISEGLYCSTHPEGCHSMGNLISGGGNVSLHHNLFAHNNLRNPVVQKNGIVEWVNNVIYNANMHTVFTIKASAAGTLIRFDGIANFYKEGPNSQNRYEFEASDNNFFGAMNLYINGNIGPNRTSDTQAQQDSVDPIATRQYLIASPNVSPPQIAATSAAVAYGVVLTNAGATYPCRDSVDRRLVLDVTNGGGFLINDPSQVGGWPDLTRPCP